MRTSIPTVAGLASSLLLALLISAPLISGPSQTADVHGYHFRHHYQRGGVKLPDQGGHPDPCWPLRIQEMVTHSSYWWWRFEECLDYYNSYTS